MKNTIKGFACLLLPLLITACGHGWRHKTEPAAKWDAAYADCVYEAESQAKTPRLTKTRPRIGHIWQVRYLTDKCMEEKGYFQAGE